MNMYQTIYINSELVKKIDQEVNKIGYGANRSAWISVACQEKIDKKTIQLDTIINLLETWIKTFPRPPLQEVIENIKNGKI